MFRAFRGQGLRFLLLLQESKHLLLRISDTSSDYGFEAGDQSSLSISIPMHEANSAMAQDLYQLYLGLVHPDTWVILILVETNQLRLAKALLFITSPQSYTRSWDEQLKLKKPLA